MMATLANVGPMFGGVRPVVQHWPTLPPPLATLGRTLANVRIANVGQCWTQCLATFLKKGSLAPIMEIIPDVVGQRMCNIGSNIGQCWAQCWGTQCYRQITLDPMM